MTAISIVFMILAITIVWGGLVASMLYLRARPERAQYPAGAAEDDREQDPVLEHDT